VKCSSIFEVRGRRDLFVELVGRCTSASKQELGKIGKCDLIRDHMEGEEEVVSADAYVCLVVQPLGRGV
jgi:hypothetical protein